MATSMPEMKGWYDIFVIVHVVRAPFMADRRAVSCNCKKPTTVALSSIKSLLLCQFVDLCTFLRASCTSSTTVTCHTAVLEVLGPSLMQVL